MNTQSESTPTAARGSEPDADLTTARILIIDDDDEARLLLRGLLSERGYRNSAELEDGGRAIERILTQRPDLTLLDVEMPGADGLSILRTVRADDAGADLPIVIVTATDDDDTRQAALEAGATDFLTKPVQPGELIARVRNVLRGWLQRKRIAWQLAWLEQAYAERERMARELAAAKGAAESAERDARHRLQQVGQEIQRLLDAVADPLARLPLPSASTPEHEHLRSLQTSMRLLSQILGDLMNASTSTSPSLPAAPIKRDRPPVHENASPPAADRTGATAPAQTTDGASLLDRQRLLERCLNNPDLADQILVRFVNELPEYAGKIDAHQRAGDAAGLRALAHKLKGASANLCAEPLATRARALEERLRADLDADAAQEITELHAEIEALLQHVAAQVGRNNDDGMRKCGTMRG